MTSDRERSDELYGQAQHLVASPDHVDLRVEFDWDHVGAAHLDGDSAQLILPDGIKGPGIYLLRSGRRNTDGKFDCWYVGRSMVDAEGRVAVHAAGEFDEESRRLKRFRSNLENEHGWVEVDRAVNIRVNGVSTLQMLPPSDRKSNPDQWEVVEIVFNLIEATGLASQLLYGGRASKK